MKNNEILLMVTAAAVTIVFGLAGMSVVCCVGCVIPYARQQQEDFNRREFKRIVKKAFEEP